MSKTRILLASVDEKTIELVNKLDNPKVSFGVYRSIEEALGRLNTDTYSLAILDQNICKSIPDKLFKTSTARSTPIVLIAKEQNDEIVSFLNPNKVIPSLDLNSLNTIIEKTLSINSYIKKHERTNELNSSITKIAELFLSADPYELEKPFNLALEKITTFTTNDGAAIFRYNEDNKTLSNFSQIGNLTHIDKIELEKFPWLLHKFIIESNLFVANVSGLPPDATEAKNLLYNLNVGSFSIIPIKDSEFLVGALIVYSKMTKSIWSEESRAFLSQAGKLFGLTLARRRRRKIALARIDILEGILRATEQRYQNIMESLSEGLVMSDENGVLTYVNSCFSEITGYKKEEIIGNKIYEIFFKASKKDKSKETIAMLQRIKDREKGISERYNIEVNKKDGEPIWLDVSAGPLRDSEGNLIGSTGMITDITEKKKLEQQLLLSQKMEAVGRLAGGVAHDFNNLLTVVSGYSEILLKSLNKDEKNYKYVNAIKEASKSAVNLTQQLLTVSKREVVESSATNINEVIKGNSGILKGLVDEQIDLDFELKPGLANVAVNSSKLEQIILNLIINAKDSIKTQGKVEVKTFEYQSKETFFYDNLKIPAGKYVAVSVKDSGEGINEKTIKHLYEPFFTTKKTGSGLGLSTVYGIVKQHKGNITLKTKINSGSTFTVFFPLLEIEKKFSDINLIKKEDLKGDENILLVEDEDGVRELISEILNEQGYQVTTASNGQEALGIIQDSKNNFDLLVTDVIMPKLSGLQLVEKLIDSNDNTSQMKIIIMSACTQELKTPEKLKSYSLPFIAKPFSSDDFLEKVRSVLDTIHFSKKMELEKKKNKKTANRF